MKIAIIDADLIGSKRHRFPNLVCMKMFGFYKKRENTVELKTDYDKLSEYDQVLASKVFAEIPISDALLALPNVTYRGTGFL